MTTATQLRGPSRFLPVLDWGRRYRRGDLRPDLVAGLTVGAMLVPQGMAYAQLAGLPPEIGLYSVTVPLIVYALFGTSRQLAVGPVAVVSLLTASALAPIAESGTAEYLAAAALLAVMVGVANIVLGLARQGWVTNLLSHPVLVGYTAAAAIIIGASQLKHLFGVKIPRTEQLGETLLEIGKVLDETELLTLGIGVATIVALVLLKRWKKTFPGALAVVVVATLASAVFDLADRGVATVGEIPSGLPGFGLPSIEGSWIGQLVPMALTITLVGYMESIAVAKVYARKNRYEVEPNQELVALGAANVAAGVFSGQPVTGGFSRTAVNATAGARTPLASMVSASMIVLVLLLLTGLFTELPQAVLGAIVIAAVASLFDWHEMRHIMSVKRSDAATMAIAFVATLVLGVELGIAVAVAVSLVVVFARIMKPHSAEVGRLPGGETYRNIQRFPEAETVPGIGILRIDVSLNFANVAFLKQRLRRLEADHPEGLHHIVLDGAGINDMDASAESALSDLVDEYDDRGISIHLADMKGPVRDVLMRSGLWVRMIERVHPSVHQAVQSILGGADEAERLVGLDERMAP
ncbi:MAG: sulfate permease [Ilumatobacteraceae bacterium]|jgi:SulP family sulfate permease|nr:sulfate permease [Ilumatobacteraceae bacterium]